jgi:hypothetical protein
MTPSVPTLYSLAALLSVAALAPAAWTRSRAARDAHDAALRLARIQANARAVADTQSTLPDWAAGAGSPSARAQSADALAPRVSAALAAAGLPAATLSSLSVQSDPEGAGPGAPAGSLRIQRRRATLVLAQPTLPQLGAFLQSWRTREPTWTITSIDAAPEPSSRADKPTPPGADLPLHIVLSLESLSLVPAGGTR